ncbi:hypothetical protein CIG19_06620 [Enterobacterales bacterium CwR94]|nr:hypothetical protein CIG19_06620 [Enterobacterales bacterium CwR94]
MACDGLCDAKGLAIMPVRYAVIPGYLDATLPAWAQDGNTTAVALENDEKYALRVLRQGYMYIFYEKGACGERYWECYSVAEDGSLWRQFSAARPLSVQKPQCSAAHHNPINVAFLTIASPQTCGNIWLAFSQYPWETETLDRYRDDAKARDARMLRFSPQSWLTSQRTSPGTIATTDALESVLDYQQGPHTGRLPGPYQQQSTPFSTAPALKVEPKGETDGWEYNAGMLNDCTTLYAWSRGRECRAQLTALQMQARSGEDAPVLLPLWDAIGITHELNGWCQDALGRRAEFEQERDLELQTLSSLDGLREVIGKRDEARIERYLDVRGRSGEPFLSEDTLSARMAAAEQRYADHPDVLAQVRQDNALLASWRGKHVELVHIQGIIFSNPRQLASHRRRVEQIKAEVAAEEARRPQSRRDSEVTAWKHYEKRLSLPRIDNFKACYEKLKRESDDLFAIRTRSLLNWLSAPQLSITLDDLHCTSKRAGLFYQSAVTAAITGIERCEGGATLLDSWLGEFSTCNRHNLAWRHIAANNPLMLAELEPLLAMVKAEPEEMITPANADPVVARLMATAGVMNKTLEYYGLAEANKNQSHWNNNTHGLEQRLSRADAVTITLGDRITKMSRLTAVGESMTTTSFRLIFMIRAGIPMEWVERTLTANLHESPATRALLLEAFRRSNEFMSPEAEVLARRQSMRKNLSNYLETEEGRGKMREARIGAMLLVFNAIELVWLINECREDRKPLTSVLASGLMVATQTMTMIAPAMEQGVINSQRAAGALKILGAKAGMAASGLSMFLSLDSAFTEGEKGHNGMSTLNALRGGTDVISFIKYSGDLLKLFKYESTEKISNGIRFFLTKKFFGVRVLTIMISWQFQVGILLLQGVIAIVQDDDLQIWCNNCVFGLSPAGKSWRKQQELLEQAVKDIT